MNKNYYELKGKRFGQRSVSTMNVLDITEDRRHVASLGGATNPDPNVDCKRWEL